MGLDAASQTDTRTSLRQERFFFIILLLLQNHHVRWDGMQTVNTFLFPFLLAAFASVRRRVRNLAGAKRLKLPADQSRPVLCKYTQAPCQRSKGTTRAPRQVPEESFQQKTQEINKQHTEAPLGGSSRLRLEWLCALSAALHQKTLLQMTF